MQFTYILRRSFCSSHMEKFAPVAKSSHSGVRELITTCWSHSVRLVVLESTVIGSQVNMRYFEEI
jgi:hypothetical protein